MQQNKGKGEDRKNEITKATKGARKKLNERTTIL